MYIPNEAEMEMLVPIPSVEEMELSVGTSRKAKAPKPKPACKWGPRMANGKCPTKAQAGLSSAPGAGGSSKSKASQSARSGTRLGEKLAVESAKEFIQTSVRQALPRPTKKQTAAAARGAVQEIKKVGGKAAGLLTGSAAAAGLAGVGMVAAAGTAAFLGTQWLRAKLEDAAAKRAYEKSPNKLARDAEAAYSAAKLSIERDLGRKMTASEDAAIYRKFFEPIEKTLMEFLRNQ